MLLNFSLYAFHFSLLYFISTKFPPVHRQQLSHIPDATHIHPYISVLEACSAVYARMLAIWEGNGKQSTKNVEDFVYIYLLYMCKCLCICVCVLEPSWQSVCNFDGKLLLLSAFGKILQPQVGILSNLLLQLRYQCERKSCRRKQ